MGKYKQHFRDIIMRNVYRVRFSYLPNIILILVVFLIKPYDSYAQESTPISQIPGYDNILPASPEVSSLFKFVKTPVNYYTGIPDISIPIYTIKEGNIELPIVLRYHAGGIKVSEISSWVGLGWALEAGGAIGREVAGIADDRVNGFYYTGQFIPVSLNHYDQNNVDYMESVANGWNDTKPDHFYYSLPKQSGKFVFGNDQKILLVPQKKMKISVKSGSEETFDNWIVTNEAGEKYYFGGSGFDEISESLLNCTTGNSDDPQAGPYISSWMMSAIASADSQDSISFSYKSYFQILSETVNETDYLTEYETTNQCKKLTDVKCTSTIQIDGRLPEYIRTKNIDIRFYSSYYRPDLESGSEGLRLDSIEITDKSTSKKLRYCFTYDNLTDNRMWLTHLKVKNGNGNVENQYLFEYNHSIHLPLNRNEMSIDHWGYYNGQNNTTLMPPIFIGELYKKGADRNVHSEFVQAGMLTKITYPTKGYTGFIYESNDIYGRQSVLSEAVCQVGIHSSLVPGEERVKIDSFQIIQDPYDADNPDITYVRINATTFNTEDYESMAEVYLYDKNRVIYYHNTNSAETDHLAKFLNPGWYYVKAVGQLLHDEALIQVFYKIPTSTTNNRVVGGLRIKEIDHYPIIGETEKTRFEYVQFNKPGLSSGTGGKTPRYIGIYAYQTDIPLYVKQDPWTGPWVECHIQYRSSNPQSAFNNTQGSFVGYQNVRIFEGLNGENGRTENTYTSFKDFRDIYVSEVLVNSNDYKRGMLLESKTFDASGRPVSKINNQFSFLGDSIIIYDDKYKIGSTGIDIIKIRNTACEGGISTCTAEDVLYRYAPIKLIWLKDRYFSSYQGVEYRSKLGIRYSYMDDPCDGLPEGSKINGLNVFDKYICKFYTINSEFVFQTNSTATQYFQNGDSLKTSKNFFYDNWDHYQISRVSEPKNGKIYTTQYLYPEDFNDNTGFIGLLKKCHIHSKPIENVTYITDENGSNLKIIGGSINKYSNSIKDQLDTVFTLQPLSNKPIALSDFKFSNRGKGVLPSIYDPIKYNFQRDKNYLPELISDKYISGKITEYHKLNDIHTVILWGYNKTLPVAKLENVTYSTITSNTNLANYINQLQNYTDLKKASDRTSLKTLNDNIRNSVPVNTFVTTYTYMPLYGITSQTDVNGKTTYYEYDIFGRLKYIRDQDYKVIQEYNYHFKE